MQQTHDFAALREEMVARQIEARGIHDPHVLAAMREVPREAFVPPDLEGLAYSDGALPIAEDQTISQPYIVALMSEAAEPGPGDRVLDVGTGSGYAAAVLARIVDHVYSIERIEALAQGARRALAEARIDNVTVRVGDGTLGCAEEAPFDAILVAAGAPAAPETLKHQLSIGGRLVIPVQTGGYQTLRRIRRLGDDEFRAEDLGAVQFVPLIGAEGWRDRNRRESSPPILSENEIPAAIGRAAEPLPGPDDPGFGDAFDRLGSAAVVGLGEATHGTAEFYSARAAITKRLVERHGFTIVALEADWPDAARLDRYVRHRPAPPWDEPAFTRFPTWMWRNEETDRLINWLREFNADRPPERRVSIHGLDLYALNTSVNAVIGYLDEVDPELASVARRRYGCLSPWQKDPVSYGYAARHDGWEECESAVAAMLRELLEKRAALIDKDGDDYLDAEGNARLVAAAEHYYRSMFHGREDSWNLRDTHMVETLDRVRRARGHDAKAIVWAHNSHIGDASATEMGVHRGQVNIGSLCRERYGASVRLLGFDTDRGTVAAASDWGEEMELKSIRPALADSVEALCRESRGERFLLDLARERREESPLDAALLGPRLQRAIGVVYRPETERLSHYFETSLPRQFDHYVWFETTNPVTPLVTEPGRAPAETYPFGL